MIADLKPYPDYKESGLPWLGQIPGRWKVCQARHIGRFLKGVGGTKEDAVSSGVPCVRYGELYTTFTYFIRANKSFIRDERAPGYTPIQYGDVLFAASGETIEEIGKSAVNLMQVMAVCGGDIIILRPSIPVHAPYLGYAMDCRPATSQKATMARGTTVKHIYPDELRSLLVPLPTLDEQAAIVRFLDWANGRLERAIRAKKKVIALLNEQKQAIIHRAVTKGLDSLVTLKPSGVPWLGDIPQHWDVIPAKRVCTLIRDGTHLPPRRTATGVPLLSVRNIIDSRFVLRSDDSFISEADYRILAQSFEVCQNDVLLATVGATLGKVAVVGVMEPFHIQRSLAILRPRHDVLHYGFLEIFLRGPQLQRHLWQSVAFSAQPGIYLNFIKNIPLPVPPLPEQLAICAAVEVECFPIDTAITRLKSEIELLGEYRLRLIADVVTGKLDVRDVVAHLPDEATEFAEVGLETDALSSDADLDDEEART